MEGSGCWYCVKVHGTFENFIDKSPAQVQKIVNNPEAPEARSGFQARRDAVVDLASRGKKQIISTEIDQAVTMFSKPFGGYEAEVEVLAHGCV